MQRFDFHIRRREPLGSWAMQPTFERVTVAAKDSHDAINALDCFLEETGPVDYWSFTAPEPARPDQNHWFVLGKNFQLLKECNND